MWDSHLKYRAREQKPKNKKTTFAQWVMKNLQGVKQFKPIFLKFCLIS